jgi:hypothetical protein
MSRKATDDLGAPEVIVREYLHQGFGIDRDSVLRHAHELADQYRQLASLGLLRVRSSRPSLLMQPSRVIRGCPHLPVQCLTRSFLYGRNKAIAPPAHGLNDLLGPATIPRRPAGYGNTPLQGRIADKAVGPQPLEQLLSRHYSVTVLHQIRQHGKHLAVESDHASSGTEFFTKHIQCIGSKHVLHGLALLSFAAGLASV